MKCRALMTGLILAIATLTTGQAFGETMEEVEQFLTDQMAKQKSVTFKMKTITEMKNPDMTYKANAETLSEVVRRGEDKWVSRSESKISSATKVGEEKEKKEENKVLAIYDGEFLYTYSETGEQKMAMKNKVDLNSNPLNGKAMFDEIRKNYVLKLLPDETVDGKPAYVIQTTYKPRDDGKEEMGETRTVTYYSKDNGIALKAVAYDKEGKATFTMTVSDIKINEEIKPERFVFKAPAGVEVQDMTKTEAPPAEETAEKPAPAPEEKAEEDKKADAKPKEEEKPKKKKGIGGLLDKIK